MVVSSPGGSGLRLPVLGFRPLGVGFVVVGFCLPLGLSVVGLSGLLQCVSCRVRLGGHGSLLLLGGCLVSCLAAVAALSPGCCGGCRV